MSNEKFGISDPLITAFINARVLGHVDTRADLSAIGLKRRATGASCTVRGTHEIWIWDASSTDPAATGLVIVPDDIAALSTYIADQASEAGRWILSNSQSAIGLASSWKQPVRAASTANFAGTRTGNVLLASSNGALAAMDGVTLAVGDRVLLKNQTTGADNGIYVVGSLGGASAKASFTRASDANTTAKVPTGLRVAVTEGSVSQKRVYALHTTSITLNSTTLVFTDTAVQTGQAVRTVRGVVTSDVADLSAFTVAGNDGLTYAAGERVLLAKQTTTTQSGIYVVGTVSGGAAALTLAEDWSSGSIQPGGVQVLVNEGTAWAGTRWFASLAGPCTVGTSSPAFYPKEYTLTSGNLSGTPGTLAISNVWILHATKSTVILSRRAAGGTLGNLSFGVLTAGAGSGSFTITSSGNETSTVDYTIRN